MVQKDMLISTGKGNQKRIALRNYGKIDPTSIDDYMERDGYKALKKVIYEMTPFEVIDEVKNSGLRGRGGGGFPTGKKWEMTRGDSPEKIYKDKKYVICNADEGDPGAFMDRSIIEGDPYSIIEAMTIAAYSIGAEEGYIYVRAEYPIAVKTLREAIRRAKDKGVLGHNIFNSNFSFDLDIRIGAGAFVCGEETALINSIEGHRGNPRSKPPFPSEKGLWGKATLINNVETFANIPMIILKGGDWYSQYGTEKSRGTKVFALAGDINNSGLIEVPMGTSLKTIIYDLGGGIANNKKFKAAQIGGPSGGVLTREHLNIALDYDNLREIGTMIGSGGLVIMDEDTCMVDIARYYLDFTEDESCRKCTPCRIGTKRMLELLNKIASGKGEAGDIELLEELAELIKKTSLCGLGQSAPNPVLSTLKHFRKEYEIHIMDRYCPFGVCKLSDGKSENKKKIKNI